MVIVMGVISVHNIIIIMLKATGGVQKEMDLITMIRYILFITVVCITLF